MGGQSTPAAPSGQPASGWSARLGLPELLLGALTGLLSIGALLGVHVGARSFPERSFLVGGAAAVLVPWLILEHVAARIPWVERLPPRWWRVLAFVLMFLGPLGVAAWLIAPQISEGRMMRTLPLLGVVLLVAFVVSRFAYRRFGFPTTSRFWFLAAIAALEIVGLMFWLHTSQETLATVRPGRELEHEVLYTGTILLSCAVMPLWCLRLVSRRAESRPSMRGVPVWIAAAAVLGIGLLVADHHVLEGLHPPIHLWLQFVGTATLDAALFVALSRSGHPSPRARRVSIALGGAALLGLVAASAYFLAPNKVASDPVSRSGIATSNIGRALLRWHSTLHERVRKPRTGAGEHPALEYEQHLDAGIADTNANVLLITVDALRADIVLGTSPDLVAKLPTFDRLARECSVFEGARAPGSRTAIGMGSLMSGRYSANMDWELWLYRRGKIVDPSKLSDAERKKLTKKSERTTMPTAATWKPLAARLKAAGVHTAGTAYAGVNDFFSPGHGFDTGFDDYPGIERRSLETPSSGRVAELTIEQLERSHEKKGRWFQWVHFYDPHTGKKKPRHYESMVEETDAAIGALLRWLDEHDLRDKTMIVITSDHGEAFREHGFGGHGVSTYWEEIDVPLVICVPGVGGQRIAGPVSTIDATASILAYMAADTSDLDGVNLLPQITTGVRAPGRPVFSELHRFRGKKGKRSRDVHTVILDGWKLIWDRKHETLELYDLESDPRELENVLGKEPKQAARLQEIVETFVEVGERSHHLP